MANLTELDQQELLGLAREAITNYLESGRRDCPPAPEDKPAFQEKLGVFVTLHCNGELRGCIGYPLPMKPLWESVAEMAVAAAVEDPRFPAVRAEELGEIDIEISVLTVPQKIPGPDAVRVGRDGIIVSKGLMRGLLLPQVPVEQGWDLEQYVSYGCRKAGLPADEWKRGVQIETFQAIVFGEKKGAEEA
jgi:AmmeMemoRadiSam system protein A